MAKQIEQIQQRWTSRLAPPLRQWEIISRALETGTEQRGQQQETVTGHLQLRKPLDGLWIPDLPLGHSQQRFLIAVIAFDLPAIKIVLNQRL
jgi:hypothetical protein